MRHLDKRYPYQKPSRNRSSKDKNMIIGTASIFPAYKTWGDEQLVKASKRCKNQDNNCYLDELKARKASRTANKLKKANRQSKKTEVNSMPR